jgi:ethanolamine ammonia-lyase small subunit
LTLNPRTGMTDESRNCISNVRVEGLSYELAAHKLLYLMTEASKRGLSGVLLKDEAEDLSSNAVTNRQNFLLSTD